MRTVLLLFINFYSKVNRKYPRNKVLDFSNRLIIRLKLDDFIFSLILRDRTSPEVIISTIEGNEVIINLKSKTERFAYITGSYDYDMVSSILKIYDPNEVFLDIGANIGFYTLSIAKCIQRTQGNGKILAFEPFPGNFFRLRENVAINNFNSICYLYNVGLSSEKSSADLVLREDFNYGSSTGNASIAINKSFDRNYKSVQIQLERLDDFLNEIKIHKDLRINFIKLDIEGHEDLFLAGSLGVIKEHRPTILMEINKPYFRARGYNIIDLIFKPLIPENYSYFKRSGYKWDKIKNLDECQELDNVLLVDKEKVGAVNSLDNYF